ncbi:YbhB/YbcL family Raf kinase inhibitor-like protein [Microbacterium sp. ET2]|uniref:YbhB/YbcL family Raf kinase inhibitor-like protein n=1 Tax=Microbacterium albipurpureum TaxID=3050384 RepID=UPI00259D053A|nr:YbhB/YbcL family Raf kinase inhibitor-like protein [Microbacterium sp. ET2 (Ac-2212)]WJL96917.1 YbhB/YbcL family Raf kinase inhibitor-like protein [Microbacterium sp. ET2 (Ac-2212)]
MRIDELAISSPDIPDLGDVPERFSADGGNAVPRLEITGVPEGTRALAVISHDPDAPLPHGFTHWVLYGLPPTDQTVDPATATAGPNGAGKTGWYGPQPPQGHGRHHYYFWVYALDREVSGTPSREEFLRDYADAVIEQNRFVGHFER